MGQPANQKSEEADQPPPRKAPTWVFGSVLFAALGWTVLLAFNLHDWLTCSKLFLILGACSRLPPAHDILFTQAFIVIGNSLAGLVLPSPAFLIL